mgnify:CR=1 FL=1
MNYVKYILCLGVVVAAYFVGYNHAETEGNLKLEQLRLSSSEAIVAAQTNAKLNYKKQMQDLVSAHQLERDHYNERLRQLEKFRDASGDLAACRRDRSRLARVAIGFESLTIRAIDDLKTTLGHRQN